MTLSAIKHAITELPDEKAKELHEWWENYLEDQLEFTYEFAAALEQAEKDLANGKGRIRNPLPHPKGKVDPKGFKAKRLY